VWRVVSANPKCLLADTNHEVGVQVRLLGLESRLRVARDRSEKILAAPPPISSWESFEPVSTSATVRPCWCSMSSRVDLPHHQAGIRSSTMAALLPAVHRWMSSGTGETGSLSAGMKRPVVPRSCAQSARGTLQPQPPGGIHLSKNPHLSKDPHVRKNPHVSKNIGRAGRLSTPRPSMEYTSPIGAKSLRVRKTGRKIVRHPAIAARLASRLGECPNGMGAV
jgi:hypothetical protein